MSQFDRYDNPEIERECDWEVFIDKESPNIVNVRFGRYQEITIPPKFQWEEGQYIRFLDIDSEKIQECDFSVNGVIDSVIHYVNDGMVEIPNSLFTHHGNAKCFVKHVGEDNITVIRVISFLINRREKPQDYVSPDDEQTFRQWVQEQLDKGLIEDITEIPSTEDDGINILTITMKDGKEYIFTVKNGSKGEAGQGIAEGGTTGQVLAKKSDEDYDTEWVEIPTPATVVQEEGQNTEDVMSQKAVTDSVTNIRSDISEISSSIETIQGSIESIIEDKMDKDTNATEDNIAIFNANGNVVDSGVNLDNIQVECDDHLDTESENPVQNKVLADIIPYKADYTYVNSKVDELNTYIGTKASKSYVDNELLTKADTTYVDTELAKKASTSDVDSALALKADKTYVDTQLGLKADTTYVDSKLSTKADVSDLPSSDRLLPTTTSSDVGKILKVNAQGVWGKAEDSGSGTETHTGQGAPSSSIVASVGDFYRDTITNKLYQCSEWRDPSVITDLTGLTILFNDTVTTPYGWSLSINFTSNDTSYTEFNINPTQHTLTYKYNGSPVVYTNGVWSDNAYRTVTFSGGAQKSNQDFINWIIANASIGNLGSTWVEVASKDQLPSVTSADEDKVLQVNNLGEWVANEITTSGVVAFNGAGAPTSSIVAKVGDLYRDTTTDKLYQCSNYISPSGITDLTGLTVVFANSITFTDRFSDYLNFTSNGTSYTSIWVYDDMEQILYVQTSGTLVYGNGQWSADEYRTVTFTSGSLLTNSDFISWVLANASIEGLGSTWVEVVAKDDRIPTVTSADENKVMTVNSSGNWTASNIPNELPNVTSADEGKVLTVDSQGTWFAGNSSSESSTHTGHGVPIATIVAKVGDIYTDLDTNEAYVCTNYVDPTVAITDLTGKTFYFNETLSEEDIVYIYEKYSETTGQGGYTFSSLQYINVDRNQNVQYDLSFRHNITSVDYYVLVSFSNGTLYETYNGGRWYNANLRRIQFTGGTDATNPDLIDFVTSNAILDNTGSTWTKLVASPLTATPTYNGSILQWNKSTNKWQANAGSIYFYTSSDNSGTYTRIDPGNGITVSSGYNIVAQYTSDPRTIWYRINSSNHYLFRMLLKTLLLPADNGCQSITNGSDMSNTMYFKAGQYGYVPATTAASLLNCPTQEGFVLTVIWLNQSYYILSNESNTKGVRFIITDSGKIYRQYVYNTSATWYRGEEWKCITNGEVIPDAPTTDGNYVLKCSVSSGVPTYSWVLET